MSRKEGKNSNAGNREVSSKIRSGPKNEMEIAIDILVELRDVRKKQIFLQMAEEIEDLKKKLSKALDLAEYHQKRAKDLTIENDWLHSLTCTPAVSPDKKVTVVHTPFNLDKISKKFKKSMKIQRKCRWWWPSRELPKSLKKSEVDEEKSNRMSNTKIQNFVVNLLKTENCVLEIDLQCNDCFRRINYPGANEIQLKKIPKHFSSFVCTYLLK